MIDSLIKPIIYATAMSESETMGLNSQLLMSRYVNG